MSSLLNNISRNTDFYKTLKETFVLICRHGEKGKFGRELLQLSRNFDEVRIFVLQLFFINPWCHSKYALTCCLKKKKVYTINLIT